MILKDGQAVFNHPVYVYPRKDLSGPIAQSVAAAFKSRVVLSPIPVDVEQVSLRWMKPDGNGGLVPR